MYRDLLSQSSLLVLPLIALFLFIAVFVGVVVRTLMRSRAEIDECAAIPLHDEDRHEL
jgi:cbb3-type cytochrome oxidase subunit 3